MDAPPDAGYGFAKPRHTVEHGIAPFSGARKRCAVSIAAPRRGLPCLVAGATLPGLSGWSHRAHVDGAVTVLPTLRECGRMDSQHRHELQQSDLAEFIAHFGEWWRKHGFKTLLLLLIVVGAAFIYRTYRTGVANTHDRAWFDLDQATSADQYHGVAREHDVPAIRALAHLRAGDWSLRRALAPDLEVTSGDLKGGKQTTGAGSTGDENADPTAIGDENTDAVATGDENTDAAATGDEGTDAAAIEAAEAKAAAMAAAIEKRRQELLADAEQDYQAVVDDPAAHSVLRLNALLGLAAVAESRQQWDQARALYQQVEQQASSGQERLKELASRHAAALDRVAKPVIFAPEPPPASQPASLELPAEIPDAAPTADSEPAEAELDPGPAATP